MKVYTNLTNTLNRFRNKSTTHSMAFNWSGTSMKLYQNGSVFTISDIFQGCFMPKGEVKGIILPNDIDKFIEVQDFIDGNLEDIIISPQKWGYNILKLNPKGGDPLLVHELRFYSIKGFLPLLFCKLIFPKMRIALKNV